MKTFQLAIRDAFGRNAHSRAIFEAFGMANCAKWPDAGCASRVIQGVRTWVIPKPPKAARKSSKHRVMCECPRCGLHLSVGRLHQHSCPMPFGTRIEVITLNVASLVEGQDTDPARRAFRATCYADPTHDHITDVFEQTRYVGEPTNANIQRERNAFIRYITNNFIEPRFPEVAA